MRQRVRSRTFGVALIAHTYGRKNTSKERKGSRERCYGPNCPPNNGQECWGACPCLSKTRSVAYLFRQAFRPMSASQLATRVVKATSTTSANPAMNKLFEPPTSNPLNLPLFEPVSTQVFVVVHPNIDIETESHKRDGRVCGSIRSSRERPLADLWSTQKNVVGGNVSVCLSDSLLKAPCSFEYFQNRALSCAR